MNRRQGLATLSAAALICLSGCASDEPSDAAPAKDTEPVTLRIVTYDEEVVAGGAMVEHWAQTVQDLEPTITIETSYKAAPDEEATIDMIQDGNADLGLVATRAWDLVGVDTMRAINTPFLIDSTELLDQVVASDQAATMMAGLSEAGMTGLAMLPESLRHPFGTEGSPMGPADYEGETIRSPHSTTTWDVMNALGASPEFEDEAYPIAESQFEQAPAAEATGNVTLFAKADVIVISDAAKEKVSASQLDALVEAAETTRDWAIGTFPDDAESAATYCANGGRIVAASTADLAGLADAVAPVVAELKQDETTAEVIAAIEELKSGITTPAPVTACPDSSTSAKASELNGTYEYVITREALEEAGVTNPVHLEDIPSEITATLDDGGLTLAYKNTAGPHKGDTGEFLATYEFDGDRMIVHWSQAATDCTSVTVTILDDGDLEFSDVIECAENEGDILLDQVGFRYWDKVK